MPYTLTLTVNVVGRVFHGVLLLDPTKVGAKSIRIRIRIAPYFRLGDIGHLPPYTPILSY